MTPSPQRAPWPLITVRLDEHGTAEVDRLGTTHTLTGDDTHAARQLVTDWIAQHVAGPATRPVAVTITDPDGTWHLTIDGDGTRRPSDHGEDRPHRATRKSRPGPPPPAPSPAAFTSEADPEPPLEPEAASPAPEPAPGSVEPSTAPQTRAEARNVPAARPSFITAGRTVRPAEHGWRGSLNRMGFRLAPGTDELAMRQDVEAVSQHWGGPRTIAIVNGKGSASKALGNDEPVLTPTGYRRIADLQVGDDVIGTDGLTYPVLGVYPQGERDLYKVTFSDGNYVLADPEHLWDVQAVNERAWLAGACTQEGCDRPLLATGWCRAHYGQARRGAPLGTIRTGGYASIQRTPSGGRLMTTAELLASGLAAPRSGPPGAKRYKWFVPVAEPAKLPATDLPLDPYLLGLLLGDGSFTRAGGCISFSTADPELVQSVRERLPAGAQVRFKDRCDYRIVRTAQTGPNPVRTCLDNLGLWGATSTTKHVPDVYKWADADARLAVLQGLLDSDGHHARGTAAVLGTVSPRLADDIRCLAETLGCVVTRNKPKRGSYRLPDRTLRYGQTVHTLRIRPPAGVCLFRLPRKAASQRDTVRRPRRAITSITPAGRGQATCIAVASPDHLFLTRGCIPTHNTPTTACLAAVFARYGGAGVLAWDNNETRGSLAWRTEESAHQSTVLDLLPRVDALMATTAQYAELAHYVHHQPADKYDVLWSDQSVEGDHIVTADEVATIHQLAARYYRMVVMDSGNSERAENWRAMVYRADRLVVPCTNVEDTAEAGARLIEALTARSEHAAALARSAVVLVSQRTEGRDPNMDRIVRGFTDMGLDVATIPYDPALQTGVIRYDDLRPATRRAWLHAAATIARGL